MQGPLSQRPRAVAPLQVVSDDAGFRRSADDRKKVVCIPFRQVVGRLARRGQSADKIHVHCALFKDTVDERVFTTVAERGEQLEGFLADLYRMQYVPAA